MTASQVKQVDTLNDESDTEKAPQHARHSQPNPMIFEKVENAGGAEMADVVDEDVEESLERSKGLPAVSRKTFDHDESDDDEGDKEAGEFMRSFKGDEGQQRVVDEVRRD